MKGYVNNFTSISVNDNSSDSRNHREILMDKLIMRDDIKVFPDGDEELDYIRKHAPAEIIIKSIAIRRAQQIAQNYARKYKPELLHKFHIKSLLEQRSIKKYLPEKAEGGKDE